MKKIIQIVSFSILSIGFLSGCQDVIPLDISTGASQLVVDGWITNQPTTQTIRLSESGAYFDNGPAKPVLNATVTVTDNKGKVFLFKDTKNNGQYSWIPTTKLDTLGRVGGSYTLNVKFGNEEYTARARINRVPQIDSITYFADKLPVKPTDGSPQEGYVAEFFGRDPQGEGDCYWIKAARNDTLFNQTTNINLAYDAGFSPGSATDGLTFILPLRRSISPRFYLEKDKVRVELHSISLDTFYFLSQVRQESNNAGLFATAPANIFTNVNNANPNGRKALGFFGASAVSTFETTIDSKKAKPKP
ncbi:MAG: DUF4249 domain-containing protein [Spirosomataceae bacterium]